MFFVFFSWETKSGEKWCTIFLFVPKGENIYKNVTKIGVVGQGGQKTMFTKGSYKILVFSRKYLMYFKK